MYRMDSINEETQSIDEKLQALQEKAKEIASFINSLSVIKEKLQGKKNTIKGIIEKKIEDNVKELNKWKEWLFTVVDESIDEKIDKLNVQENNFRTTMAEMERVVTHERAKREAQKPEDPESDNDESESEDPKLEDLLALEVDLQPEGLTNHETTELESRVKHDFHVLLNEPKKSLRRAFAYVGGIIRGYLRRGKTNVNWIKIMRKLEGREYEESMFSENDPFIGTKHAIECPPAEVNECAQHMWDCMVGIYENRSDREKIGELTVQLYKLHDQSPDDVEFFLPQLCYLALNRYDEFAPIKAFILEKSKQSLHFAMQTYLLIRAALDSREPPKKRRI